ncbi:YxiJ-like family protein [Bacillus toyonensis]
MKLGKQIMFNELQKCIVLYINHFRIVTFKKYGKIIKNMFTEDDCISADLNYYWMHTAGTLSYVLNENEKEISFEQIKWLRKSFFEWFPQYRFIETEIVKYPVLYRNFMNYEKARKLLLYYLTE